MQNAPTHDVWKSGGSCGHSSTTTPRTENVPAGHAWHVVCGGARNCPEGHVRAHGMIWGGAGRSAKAGRSGTRQFRHRGG